MTARLVRYLYTHVTGMIFFSGERANVFVYKNKQNMNEPCTSRDTGSRNKWSNIAAVNSGKRIQSKRFHYAQAVTDRVRAAHPHATITAVGHSIGRGITKGHTCRSRLTGYEFAQMCCTNAGNRYGDVISVCPCPTQELSETLRFVRIIVEK
jgi:hypothetical protein